MSEPGPRPGSRTKSGLAAVEIKVWITVLILCFVNLVNWIDRYSLSCVLDDILIYYNIQADVSDLISLSFMIAYIIVAPLLGYLGDRYNRKFTMAAGTLFWSITTMTCSFMTNFYSFLFFRVLASIGGASYSIMAPAIICDMFVNELRCDMLALYYFMVPVGSGLGLLLGTEMVKAFGAWQWGLRVTPFCGIVSVLLILFAMHDPIRGKAEYPSGSPPVTSWTVDLKSLCKNISFLLATAGFSCASFVADVLGRWYPIYVYSGHVLSDKTDEISLKIISEHFELLIAISGLVGVPIGLLLAAKLRNVYSTVDPLICGVALLLATPMLYLSIILADSMSLWGCYSLIFIVIAALNTTWLVVSDMNLYVIIPTRRATAAAIQSSVTQVLGDAISPYLIHVLAEVIKKHAMTSKPNLKPKMDFCSLQYALYSTCVVQFFGGFFFLFIVKYIIRDNDNELSTSSGENDEGSSTNF